MTAPVLGEVRHPVVDGILRCVVADRFAADRDHSCVGWRDAEQAPGDLGATAADQSAEPENFALMDVEADVAELVGSTQSGDAHSDWTGLDRLAIGVEIDFAPDHQFHGTVRRQLIDWQLLYEPSVPKYCDSIGDPKDLLEPVADEHHCHALGAEVLDDCKQA